MSRASLPAGAGLTFHPALLSSILRSPPAFLEFVAEGLSTTAQKKQARALAEMVPISVHGVSLSLGSADGIDDARVRVLRDAAAAVGAVAVSEHLSFVRAGGHEIGHLTPLPFTRAAVDVVARNVERAQRLLPQLWLENVWSPLPGHRLPDEMEEPEFLCAIVERTGCGLLLDVANLVANAHNRGCGPLAWLERLPLHAVKQLHVAGSDEDADGFVIDTHADAVAEDVFEFAAAVVARTGPLPICLERDRDVVVDEVEGELARIAAIVRGQHGAPAAARVVGGERSHRPRFPVALRAGGAGIPAARADMALADTTLAGTALAGTALADTALADTALADTALADWQRSLARDLVNDSGAVDVDLRRARGILARKGAEKAAHAQKQTQTTTPKTWLSSLWGNS